MTETTTDIRSQKIQEILHRVDIRSKKWEYRVILDSLQIFNSDGANVPTLIAEINNTHSCELVNSNTLRYNINALIKEGAVHYNELTKKYTIDRKYVTSEIKYLPLSSYCVVVFGISVVGLIASIYYNEMMIYSLVSVLSGAVYIFAQKLGSEFDFGGTIEKIKTIGTSQENNDEMRQLQ